MFLNEDLSKATITIISENKKHLTKINFKIITDPPKRKSAGIYYFVLIVLIFLQINPGKNKSLGPNFGTSGIKDVKFLLEFTLSNF